METARFLLRDHVSSKTVHLGMLLMRILNSYCSSCSSARARSAMCSPDTRGCLLSCCRQVLLKTGVHGHVGSAGKACEAVFAEPSWDQLGALCWGRTCTWAAAPRLSVPAEPHGSCQFVCLEHSMAMGQQQSMCLLRT